MDESYAWERGYFRQQHHELAGLPAWGISTVKDVERRVLVDCDYVYVTSSFCLF